MTLETCPRGRTHQQSLIFYYQRPLFCSFQNSCRAYRWRGLPRWVGGVAWHSCLQVNRRCGVAGGSSTGFHRACYSGEGGYQDRRHDLATDDGACPAAAGGKVSRGWQHNWSERE